MSDIKALDRQYVANTYARFPVEIVSGKGSLVKDDAGKEYIDMGSGIGMTAFGIADEEWLAAVTEQLRRVQHMSNLYYTEPCVRLAEELCVRSGMKKVFFCNSGAEANEGAIKAARKYAAEKKGRDHFTIVTLENSFHGRTITTLAATGQEHYHEQFQPLTPGFVHARPGDTAGTIALAREHKAAGILIECIQGEGGVVPLDRAYVRALADFCREEDVLLMVDEVQTGNGRTGALYACMEYGVRPDILSTAKGLGGGLPLGAVLLGDKTEGVLGTGDHGSTFGGNPIACAGALSVIRRLTDPFRASVAEKGRYVRERLAGAEGVEEITGLGLMIGIRTVRPAGDVVRACMENGVLCLTAKEKVRLLPALNIPMELLEKAVDVIRAACV